MEVKILMILLLAFGARGARVEISSVDELRNALVEKNDEVRVSVDQGDKSHLDIIASYEAMGNMIENAFPNQESADFRVLNRFRPWKKVQSEIEIIESLYQKFRVKQKELVRNIGRFEIQEWTNFAEAVLNDPKESVLAKLENITNIIVYQGLFGAYKEVSSLICDAKQSPQQLLYNLYNSIALTEMKGYLMMQYSYTLLRIHNKKNYTREMEKTKQDYAQRTSETLRHVKISMAFAPRDIWRCDPNQYIEDETYTELKELFQGYVVNEVDLNPSGTCKESCSYYSYARVHSCYANEYCTQQQRCKGKVLNCQFIKSDMTICPAKKESQRRYGFIEYENGRVLGKRASCPKKTSVESWWRWLFWHCSYCFCTCDDQTPNSDRYFNLREVTSNIDENKVVTGIRFRKENHVIHIQIQESVLLPKGAIDAESSFWKPIDNYTIHDYNVHNGNDYHTMAWEKRAIDLDDLTPNLELQLLTGLKFKVIGAHLNLEIRTTTFNFSTGKLDAKKTHWHSNDNTDADGNANGKTPKARGEVILNQPDIPTHSLSSFPDSESNQYLHFQPSDMDKDAAQSTVPFLDIQPVTPVPPSPISGAGIFHKGRHGSGGFVALKLITYDFTQHLRAELPETPIPTRVVGLSNEIYAV